MNSAFTVQLRGRIGSPAQRAVAEEALVP